MRQRLYQAGANIPADDHYAVRYAAANGHLEMVQWLVLAARYRRTETEALLRSVINNL